MNRGFSSPILYWLAVVLVIAWLVGYLGFNVGNLIHILLVIAIVALLLRIIGGSRV
jgi:hypothetical protein